MLFNLLSTDMYVSYNTELASVIGLHPAIYISELININRKAIQKDKLADGFFKVDRKYISQRTTFSEKEQRELDSTLKDLNIISIGNNKDFLKVDMDSLTGLILEKNKKIVDTITKSVIRKKSTKQEQIVENLKSNILTTNSELFNAYNDWIDSVIARQGWMSKRSIINGQQIIDEYTNRDLDLALKIIDIASINGWRDMSWAINEFEQKYKTKYYSQINSQIINRETNISNEVF